MRGLIKTLGILIPVSPDLAHEAAVPSGVIKIIGYENSVDDAGYPEKQGEKTAQYKCADAPGG